MRQSPSRPRVCLPLSPALCPYSDGWPKLSNAFLNHYPIFTLVQQTSGMEDIEILDTLSPIDFWEFTTHAIFFLQKFFTCFYLETYISEFWDFCFDKFVKNSRGRQTFDRVLRYHTYFFKIMPVALWGDENTRFEFVFIIQKLAIRVIFKDLLDVIANLFLKSILF